MSAAIDERFWQAVSEEGLDRSLLEVPILRDDSNEPRKWEVRDVRDGIPLRGTAEQPHTSANAEIGVGIEHAASFRLLYEDRRDQCIAHVQQLWRARPKFKGDVGWAVSRSGDGAKPGLDLFGTTNENGAVGDLLRQGQCDLLLAVFVEWLRIAALAVADPSRPEFAM